MIRPTATARQDASNAVSAALIADSSWIMLNFPLARTGDPDGVHRMRTSVRRLRCDLKTFRDSIDAEVALSLRIELKWLFNQLGNVRELDTQIRCCRLGWENDLSTNGNPIDFQELTPLFEKLKQERRDAAKNLIKTLNSPRFWSLAQRLAHGIPLLNVRDKSSARSQLRELADMARKLRQSARALTPDTSTDTDFHNVRLIAKRVRYGAEAIAQWSRFRRCSKIARVLATKVKQIQDALGERQDMVVAAAVVKKALLSDDHHGQSDQGQKVTTAALALVEALNTRRDLAQERSMTLLKRFRRETCSHVSDLVCQN